MSKQEMVDDVLFPAVELASNRQVGDMPEAVNPFTKLPDYKSCQRTAWSYDTAGLPDDTTQQILWPGEHHPTTPSPCPLIQFLARPQAVVPKLL